MSYYVRDPLQPPLPVTRKPLGAPDCSAQIVLAARDILTHKTSSRMTRGKFVLEVDLCSRLFHLTEVASGQITIHSVYT